MTQAKLRLAALAALVAIAACGATPTTVRDEDVRWQPAQPIASFSATDAGAKPNVRSRFDRGTTIELQREPKAGRGIPLPGGGFLPALNGVVVSSPIDRPHNKGVLPVVVAIVVDDSGLEWYRHADGSMTTSRYVFNPSQKRWEAATFHAIP